MTEHLTSLFKATENNFEIVAEIKENVGLREDAMIAAVRQFVAQQITETVAKSDKVIKRQLSTLKHELKDYADERIPDIPPAQIEMRGTEIRYLQEDGTWSDWVDLKGPPGPRGSNAAGGGTYMPKSMGGGGAFEGSALIGGGGADFNPSLMVGGGGSNFNPSTTFVGSP